MLEGTQLRALREVRGWTLDYTAKRAGVSHSTLSRLERGFRTVRAETLQRILDALLSEDDGRE